MLSVTFSFKFQYCTCTIIYKTHDPNICKSLRGFQLYFHLLLYVIAATLSEYQRLVVTNYLTSKNNTDIYISAKSLYLFLGCNIGTNFCEEKNNKSNLRAKYNVIYLP